MGCAFSSEVMTPEQIEQIERQAFDAIPAAPGSRAGTPGSEFKSAVCQVPVQLQFGRGRAAQLDQVHQAIGAAETAGSGFRCREFFMPWTQRHSGNIVIEVPADCDSDDYHQGYACYQGRAQLIFEKIDPSDGPLETVIQAARLTFSQGLFTWNPMKVGGYEEMYAALKQLGAQGYSLSAIIEDPSLSNLNWSMKGHSIDASVQLVCQRPLGVASPPRAYHVVDVPIHQKTQMFPATRVSAHLPTLTHVLDEWYGDARRCKLVSVYTSSRASSSTGVSTAQLPCHLIFEETLPDEKYTWLIVDSAYTIHGTRHGPSVDHGRYLRDIRYAIAKGWQLAGFVDLPDGEITGFQSQSSSVKLIFQRKVTPPAPAPVVQATVVAATPVAAPTVTPAEVKPTLVVPGRAVYSPTWRRAG